MLQRLHERYPVIAIWDDHEFSDDSWQANGNYFSGAKDEWSVERKRNAERAFLEHMPIEVGLNDSTSELAIAESDLYDDTAIYRSFRWGANLELLLTDYRSYRPDHLIPENAFPGRIAVPAGNDVPEVDAYVDLDGDDFAGQKAQALPLVAALYANEGLSSEVAREHATTALQGLVSADWLNSIYEATEDASVFENAELEEMPHGISFASMGKTALYSAQGSRYVVHQGHYLTYATHLAKEAGGGALADIFGEKQEAWLQETLAASESTWRIFASSVSLLPFMLDFTDPLISAALPGGFPEEQRQPFQLNADQWDGFPLQKQELLSLLGETPNTVIISGDIHSTFAGGHNIGVEGRSPVYEFTGTAVSSVTMEGFAAELVKTLGIEGLDAAVSSLGLILRLSANDNALLPHDSLDYTETASNGYVVVEVSNEEVRARFHHYPSTEVFTSYYDDISALVALFEDSRFVVRHGELLWG